VRFSISAFMKLSSAPSAVSFAIICILVSAGAALSRFFQPSATYFTTGLHRVQFFSDRFAREYDRHKRLETAGKHPGRQKKAAAVRGQPRQRDPFISSAYLSTPWLCTPMLEYPHASVLHASVLHVSVLHTSVLHASVSDPVTDQTVSVLFSVNTCRNTAMMIMIPLMISCG
jgi:hypothetical protein